MTSPIFTDFLVECKKNLPENIVLVMDNCTTHSPDLTFEHIKKKKKMFLPPYTISVIHSLDPGIIKTFRHIYRKESLLL